MATRVNPPRGMRDFLPADKRRRDAVRDRIVAAYRQHGFSIIETPMMEDLSRLTSGMGGDNEKLAFRVMRRGIRPEQLESALTANDPELLSDLGMRFDLTVPLARFYATHQAELPKVFRSIQAAPVWRAERPQKGRYRQFMQCDIDILGEPSALAEVELLAASADAMKAVGLGAYSVRINDRRILDALLSACGFADADHPAALISVDKLDKIGVSGVIEELTDHGFGEAAKALRGHLERFAAFDGEAPSAEVFEQLLPGVDAGVGYTNLLTIVDQLSALPDPPKLVFDPTLVRGMGYYTATLFELTIDGVGYSVGGGGRYDGMIGRFLGRDVPAAGISIGFDRVVDLAVLSETETHGIALLYTANVAGTVVGLQQALIAQGKTVRVVQKPKKIASTLDELAGEGFTEFAFVDESTQSANDLEFRPISHSPKTA